MVFELTENEWHFYKYQQYTLVINIGLTLPNTTLHYTLILTHGPNQLESNLCAQQFASEVLLAGDIIDRIFFYQDACYIGLEAQIPGQGLITNFSEWVNIYNTYGVPLQVCIANGLRRGVLDASEAQRYSTDDQSIHKTLHPSFQLVGLGELAEACQSSDRIITL